jgi:LysM repeat protein
MKNLGFIKNIFTMATNKKEQPTNSESLTPPSTLSSMMNSLDESVEKEPEYDYYTVQQGDSTTKIAYKFDMR